MKNWERKILSDVCKLSSDRININKLSVKNYISTENLLQNKGGKVDASALPSAGQVVAFSPKMTLVSNIRPYFRKIYFSDSYGGCSNDVLAFIAKEGVSEKWLYYLLSQDAFFDYVMSGAKGTKMPRGDKTQIMNFPLYLPPFPEQVKMAHILDAIDEKISASNKINQNLDWEDYFSICRKIIKLEKENQNLEAQAQAIFKSWFVDFEPFKNGKFVDSELGKIPEGWRVERLGAVCECVLGGTPSRSRKEYWEGNIPWINSGKTNEFRVISPSEFISAEGLKKSATKLLPKKTTILAITGATLGQVSLLEIDACANQSVVGILENNLLPYEYIYMYVSHNIEKIISHQTGGAQQHINKDNIKNFHIILPPQCELKRYTNAVENLYSEITNLVFQSRRLSQLRDTLLPKLMSGEIDVSDVAV